MFQVKRGAMKQGTMHARKHNLCKWPPSLTQRNPRRQLLPPKGNSGIRLGDTGCRQTCWLVVGSSRSVVATEWRGSEAIHNVCDPT